MDKKFQSEITQIKLDAATFKGTGECIEPTYINYFFGNNGTGKSTIAKAIQSGLGVTYAPGVSADDCQVLIYNQEYIDRNMQNFHNLPGVFTMTEENAEIQQQIDEASRKIDAAQKIITGAETEKAKLYDKKNRLDKNLYNEVWEKTDTLRTKDFPNTQTGVSNSKKKLAEKVMEYAPTEYDLNDLKRMYSSAYAAAPKKYKLFHTIPDSSVLDNIEGNDVLSIAIVNASETQLAEFWKNISSAEWVRTGHAEYHQKAGGKCPYCSQTLPPDFEQKLTESFDDQYKKNRGRLENFLSDYRDAANTLFIPISKMPESVYPAIDLKPYKNKLDALKGIIAANIQQINAKVAKPAKIVTLDDTAPLLSDLQALIERYNKLIEENNAVVDDAPKKKEECKDKVFAYLAFFAKDIMTAYRNSYADIEKQIKEQQAIITKQNAEINELTNSIRILNSQTKETESAMNNINLMLKDAGFQGFEVCPHWEEKISPDGSVQKIIPSPVRNYAVVRTNEITGEKEIAQNLSEGEKNFIAFLYFQQSVFGSTDAENIPHKKIVVIDDPVSSMDSGTLFIVSAQIRRMIHICRNNVDNRNPVVNGNFIKQIFILTHNAYFHREVTYLYANRWDFVSFYLVRKFNNKSSVTLYDQQNPDCPSERMNINPVKNSYAALWESYKEVKSGIPLKSIIRRILEYYFLQLCGYEGDDLRKCILEDHRDDFMYDENGAETPDRYEMAKVLLSYIVADNSGVNDGINYTDDFLDVQLYRNTFKMIFKYMNQEQHFNMMMGIR